MKKSRIVRLSIAGGLILIGLIAVFVGFQLGGDKPVYWTSSGIKVGEAKQVTINKTVDPFKNLYVNSNDYKEINLSYGDEWKITGQVPKDSLLITPTQDTLTIKTKSQNRIGVFNVQNKFGFGFGSEDERNTLNITVPKDTQLNIVEIESNIGDTIVDGIKADKLTLDTDMATTTLKNSTIGALEVTTDAGSLELRETTVTATKIEMDMGSITLTNATLGATEIDMSAGSIEGKNANFQGLDISADMGSIDLTGTFLGIINLEGSAADITLKSSQSEKEFNFDLSKDAGSIELNNENIGTATIKNPEAKNTIKAKIDLGSLTLLFNQSK